MRKILKRKLLFKGRLISLFIEKQRYPNRYIAELEVVKHPGAVLVVPFLTRDKVILIRQYRPVIGSYIWELPAGTLHKKELPAECARREMAEEIGYKAARLDRIGSIFPCPGYSTERIYIYKARGLKKIEAKEEEDELISAETFTRRRLVKLLESGKITDAKTICGLLLSNFI